MTPGASDIVHGQFVDTDDPCWPALYGALRPGTVADLFQWMGDVALDDGTLVHVYRHIETRTFLHLTDEGRALIYVGGGDRYRFVPIEDATRNAFTSRRTPFVSFEDEAGCAALDALFDIASQVSEDLGIEPPVRDAIVASGPPADPARETL